MIFSILILKIDFCLGGVRFQIRFHRALGKGGLKKDIPESCFAAGSNIYIRKTYMDYASMTNLSENVRVLSILSKVPKTNGGSVSTNKYSDLNPIGH